MELGKKKLALNNLKTFETPGEKIFKISIRGKK